MLRAVLIGFALCVFSLPVLAETYWLGLASFRGQTNAQDFQLKAGSRASAELFIRQVLTTNGEYFRVLSGPYAGIEKARAAVAEARQQGFATAWLVIGQDQRQVIALHKQQPKPLQEAKPELTQKAQPQPSSTPVQPRTSSPSTPPVAITQSPARVQQSEPIPAPEHIAVQPTPGRAIRLTRIDTTITPIDIDGHLNEAVWNSVPVIDDFVVLEPDTLQPGVHPTILRVAYDDKGLYIAADLHQPVESLVQRLSGRDLRDNRDNISITVDTSGEGRYGFWFNVNLGDSLSDGTVLPERNFTSDWDGPWVGRSQKTEHGWSAELFIPWGVVSMPASGEVRTMGLYASRNVAYLSERWGWPALPSTGAKFMSALQLVELEHIEPRQQYSIYPFIATAYDWNDERQLYRAGADIFWRPSSNFQLNATLNPDFGNVESDEVVINLTATETFFPEKRLFFLEGQEIFVASPRANTRNRGVGRGGLPYTMVNTRRIGGKPREPLVGPGVVIPQRELVQQTELAGAVKTTGQIGRFRYGLLGAAEEDVKFDVIDFDVEEGGQPRNLTQDGNDYGIARLLYEDNVGGAYRAIGVLSTAVVNPARDAMVHGIDWHFLSPTGVVKVDGQYMMSDIDDVAEKGYGGFLDFVLTYRQGFSQRIGFEYFDENIDINDLGFLQRNNEYRVRSSLQWSRSDLSWARQNQFDVRGFWQKSVTESLLSGAGIFFSDQLSLDDLSEVTGHFNYFFRSYDDLNSFGNGTYRLDDHAEASIDWESDNTQRWSYGVELGYTEENMGGSSYGYGAFLIWRPSDRFAVELNLAYDDRDGWLLHQGDDLFATFTAEQWLPQISVEYFISARQQLRLSFQYIGIKAREDEFFRIPGEPDDLIPIAKPSGEGARASYDFSVSQYSLQARYRWEIAPLSDIFLVYTRQADLRSALGDASFNDLFDTAWQAPLADVLVFKIRYRFGS